MRGQHQRVGVQFVGVGLRERALERVPELAHVARPRMGLEPRPCRRREAGAGPSPFLAQRGQIAALRATVVERRDAAERYRTLAVTTSDQIERIAQVSYDAGERGILELLDAYRTGSSTRIRQAGLDLAVRQAEVELEFVSSWEIP